MQSLTRVAAGLLAIAAVAAGPSSLSFAQEWAGRGFEPRFERIPCPDSIPALGRARCGFLVVPENRTKAESRIRRNIVAILPAVSAVPAPAPVVYLTGGPGGIALLEAQRLVDAGLNRNHLLILMNQRGTFLTKPALTCPVIDRFNEEAVGQRLDSPPTRHRHVEATAACRQHLVDQGIDLSAYNTKENAADFADLRRVLGYDRYNLYGVSYGTDLALAIMRLHPQGIRSAVLDSAVPPQRADPPDFWPNAGAGFRHLFEACRAQDACNAPFPRLEQTFTDLVRRLEAHPVSVTITDPQTHSPRRVVLDGGALVNALAAVSFYTPLFREVPKWIAALAAGDATDFATFRAASVAPPGFVGYGLTYGVFCAEQVPFSTRAEVLAVGRQAFPGYPATVLAEAPQFTYIYDDCRAWNVPSLPEMREATRSDVPTLVLSGSFDSVTAFRWAKAAAVRLTRSTLVSIAGAGHFVLPESRCAQKVVASFFKHPGSPDTACAASAPLPVFATR